MDRGEATDAAMKPTLQTILRGAWASFASGRPLPTRVTHAAAALQRCRTAAAGAQIWRCPDGHVQEIRYAPCGHRACPQCGSAHRAESLARWHRLLLPTDHFHVVFTVAHQLHELWRWNRAVVAALLFRCVRETLFGVLADPKFLGARPGVLVALHTWGRTLIVHLHLHCVVTAGGLDDHGQWRAIAGEYLAPGPLLRHRFRRTLLAALAARTQQGRLRPPPGWDQARVQRRLDVARRKPWNVRVVGRYPHGRGVATYLARYVRGGPIQNHRLLDFDGTTVRFRYVNHRRVGADGQSPQQTMPLGVEEFLRRWSEHVPVEHFHMVRTWGVYAATQRVALAQCRRQLLVPPVPRPEPDRTAGPDSDTVCPVCGRALVLSAVIPRAGAPPRRLPGNAGEYRRAA
jgi:hypothetical protein